MYQKPTNLKGLLKLVEQPDRPVRQAYYTGTQSTESERGEQRQDKKGREAKCQSRR